MSLVLKSFRLDYDGLRIIINNKNNFPAFDLEGFSIRYTRSEDLLDPQTVLQ